MKALLEVLDAAEAPAAGQLRVEVAVADPTSQGYNTKTNANTNTTTNTNTNTGANTHTDTNT